jgi:hypothetical protein
MVMLPEQRERALRVLESDVPWAGVTAIPDVIDTVAFAIKATGEPVMLAYDAANERRHEFSLACTAEEFDPERAGLGAVRAIYATFN